MKAKDIASWFAVISFILLYIDGCVYFLTQFNSFFAYMIVVFISSAIAYILLDVKEKRQ